MNYQQQADMVTVAFRESDHPTRSTKRMTIVYRDQGCGMEPAAIPGTIFALGSSHKIDTGGTRARSASAARARTGTQRPSCS